MKRDKFKCPMPVKMKSAKELPRTALTQLLIAVLNRGLPFRFKARGFSMTPFIKDGDVITIYPVSEAQVCIGDVVAFVHQKTGQLILHRLIGRKNNSFLVKGDNTLDVDGFLPKEKILGKVNTVERDGKRVYLGLGRERFLIAWLTRMNLLGPLLKRKRMMMGRPPKK